MKENPKENPKISSKEFIQNYQKAFNNYSNTVKFYHNNIKIIDTFEKIIKEYKEGIFIFQKKLSNIKKSLIKPLYEEEQKNYNFSIYNKYIQYLDNLFTFQIDSISNIINDIDKKLFSEKENNKNNNYLNILNQIKNNLQSNQPLMEKNFLEYNSAYKIFTKGFELIEEDVQKYYFNLRKKKEKDPNETFNSILIQANGIHDKFMKTHYSFLENNKKYFDFYSNKMKDLENYIVQKEDYTKEILNSFMLIIENQINSYINAIKALFSEEEKNNKEKNKDFKIFSEKNIE